MQLTALPCDDLGTQDGLEIAGAHPRNYVHWLGPDLGTRREVLLDGAAVENVCLVVRKGRAHNDRNSLSRMYLIISVVYAERPKLNTHTFTQAHIRLCL